jgi:competence protein ComEC
MGSAVLVLAAGWSTGIVLGALFPIPGLVLVVAAAATLGAVVLAPSTALRLLALALMALVLGQARMEIGRGAAPPDQLAAYAGEVQIGGRIVEAPLPRGKRVEAVVEVDTIATPASSVSMAPLGDPRPRVLLRSTFLRAGYGDRVETRGRLARPRSRPGWPLEQMLARRGIGWTVDAGGARLVEPAGTSLVGLLAKARSVFEANTRAILPEPHASLVAGIVFGARVGLPPDLRAAMSATGTSHLTAVSGANVAMVAGSLLLIATGVVGRAPASLVAIVGVWLYTLLVGAPPSALRAATMATFALAAQGLGRQPDAVVGLALAVAVLLGWDPGLAFDLGFQLSVTATAGLILLSPSIEQRLSWLPRSVRGQVAIAVAAQVATLPLVIGTFQRLSLVSLPANVLAAPTIVPIMGLGALIAVLGWVPGLDAVLGWAAWLATSVLVSVIETAAVLPGAVVAVGRSPAWLPVGWYAVLCCWVAAGSADVTALGVRPSYLKLAALVGAGLMAALIFVGWPGDGRRDGVQVALLDTEPAAAFVRTQSGGSALLITSTASRGVAASVGAQLDLWEDGVDVEIGPGGVRTAVDLLAIGAQAVPEDGAGSASSDAPDLGDLESDGSGDIAPNVAARPAIMEVGPGTRIDLADGVNVQVIDVRLAGQRSVVDLALVVDGVAILLPGPGSPSPRWVDVAPDAVTIAALPASAVTWARSLPLRNWLLLVGEPAVERARGESGVPFLARRDHGLIELSLIQGTVGVRTERCGGGRECEIQLPPPVFRALLPGPAPGGTSGGDRSPVQSGRTDDGR